MSTTNPDNDHKTSTDDEYELTFEGPGGLDVDVAVEAESREDALETLADWYWYEVGVEDTSGAWDHATVAAPDDETAEERAVEKAEATAFNKIDNGSAYDASKLGRIEQLHADWSKTYREWGDDFTVTLTAEGVESVGSPVFFEATEPLCDYIAGDDSAFAFMDRSDDPARLAPEATRQVEWAAASEYLDTETELSLMLSGPEDLLVAEFDALTDVVMDALGDEWTPVPRPEYSYRGQWGPHTVPEGITNPYGPGVTFWAYDGRAFVYGHELHAESASGDELNHVWVESGQVLAFESRTLDHTLSVHPMKASPETWEVFTAGGVKAAYEGEPEPGVYEWVADVDGTEHRYRVRAPTVADVLERDVDE